MHTCAHVCILLLQYYIITITYYNYTFIYYTLQYTVIQYTCMALNTLLYRYAYSKNYI